MRKKLIGASFTFLLWLNTLLWAEVLGSNAFELVFFDVGQGDAIYLETRQGHQVLIDGGPDETVLSRLGEVMPFWDRSLDLVILTHPDADHVTGLIEVVERYEVGAVLWTGVGKDTSAFQAFKNALEAKGIEAHVARARQRVRWSGSKAEALLVLYPFSTPPSDVPTNETSLIAKLVYRNNSVLLPGDTSAKIERQLVKEGIDVRADILKVAHHGSNSSTTREFLEAVEPATAVISVGEDNGFGHPHPDVLARLREYGIVLHRTDQEGNIFFSFYD